MFVAPLILSIIIAQCASSANGEQLAINMPDVRPDHAEQYLCVSKRVPFTPADQYIVGFNPRGDTSRVHHMLLYGCQYPGVLLRDTPDVVWDCGRMHANDNDDAMNSNQIGSYDNGPVCAGYQQILYGWALDAPSLKLPDGVGFKVGTPDSGINFLVLQVHYGHHMAFARAPAITDNSGLLLDVARSGVTKRAGILLLVSLGFVAEGKSKHEIWCEMHENIEMHPFRYRVHTHKLGTRVMGARLTPAMHRFAPQNRLSSNSSSGDDDDGVQRDVVIGVGDPQQPQMFYPVTDDGIVIRRGDTVYAHCEYDNDKGHIVDMGDTGEDEMCNFYMMYWTDSPNLIERDTCYQQNPMPRYTSLY